MLGHPGKRDGLLSKHPEGRIGLKVIFAAYWARIGTTWAIVLVENLLIALVPLLIGLSIDGLLAGRLRELAVMGGVLASLGVIAVGRRLYDTRVYGTIRLALGSRLQTEGPAVALSARTARLDMSRELVDFLELETPELITATIQIIVSFWVLAAFDWRLGFSSLLVLVGMILVYGCFHGRFYRLNAALNGQRERQVEVLRSGGKLGIFRHLRVLRRKEVAISDTEAFVYGGIFALQICFIVYNLGLGAQLPGMTAGQIFVVATYSWEYVEAALMLPLALQSWARLSEITQRLNAVG